MHQHRGTQLVKAAPQLRCLFGKGRKEGNYHGQVSADDRTHGFGRINDCSGASRRGARCHCQPSHRSGRCRFEFGSPGEGEGKPIQSEVLPAGRAVDGLSHRTAAMQNQGRLAGRRDRRKQHEVKARPAARQTGCGLCPRGPGVRFSASNQLLLPYRGKGPRRRGWSRYGAHSISAWILPKIGSTFRFDVLSRRLTLGRSVKGRPLFYPEDHSGTAAHAPRHGFLAGGQYRAYL